MRIKIPVWDSHHERERWYWTAPFDARIVFASGPVVRDGRSVELGAVVRQGQALSPAGDGQISITLEVLPLGAEREALEEAWKHFALMLASIHHAPPRLAFVAALAHQELAGRFLDYIEAGCQGG
jgi:hypothetical protein